MSGEKPFDVDVDVTMSYRVRVWADNEDDASARALAEYGNGIATGAACVFAVSVQEGSL